MANKECQTTSLQSWGSYDKEKNLYKYRTIKNINDRDQSNGSVDELDK